jgi:alpha-L-rhamnosidase
MKKYIFFLTILFNGCLLLGQSDISITLLQVENKSNPSGIVNQHPAFSWQLNSSSRNVLQTAYRILVSDNLIQLNNGVGNIWDSKNVNSSQSIQVLFAGKTLEPGKVYYWKVMVWTQDGRASGWSTPATWQMGLMSSSDWGKAEWIGIEDLPESMKVVPGIPGNGDNLGNKALTRPIIPMLRKNFNLKNEVAAATLFISGLGFYEAYINGSKVGDALLTPGWTDYDKSVLYNTYNVTSMVTKGENALGAIVGNGFYNINRERYRKLVIAYGDPKLLCKLHIEYTNGTSEDVVSGTDWKTAPSPITYTSIYSGEDYDARLEKMGWATPGYNDASWENAIIVTAPKGIVKSETDYPVTIKKSLDVKKVYYLADGKYLYDFGQNASAIVELKVKGKKGQVVRLVPAELINEKKEANQTATGRWYYYTYTLKGNGVETWRPRFSYYGFRYVQVEGATPDTAKNKEDFAQLIDLKMLHNSNSSPVNGSFECSNKLFNKTVSLINWAIQSNMQGVLTDCPHREKLGWLEQTFLMGASINYNFDIYNLYRKIVMDMTDAQTSEGLIPDIAPEYIHFDGGFRDSPEWGSASIILPYQIYKFYGDSRVMEQAWPMMVKYVEYLSSKAKDNILSYGLGDWYDLGPQRPGVAQLTPLEVTATSIYYYDLKLLSEMAGILHKKSEVARFSRWADNVKNAFNSKFFNPATCVYSTGSQTAMAMPLCFGMAAPQYTAKIVSNLVDSISAKNKALTAGDIGFHYLVEALAANGQSDLLYQMNNRDDVPGYGYQIKKGATALTESWQALEVVSNNHLMLGHLMEWFYNGIGGIKQENNSVAFKNIIIKPSVVGDLTYANSSFNSPYGTIISNWKKEKEAFVIDITIPANTTATVYIPYQAEKKIFEGNLPVNQQKDIKFIKLEGNYAVYKTGSGSYHFEVK